MPGADRTVTFNRDVRPILSDKCFGCHGPDSVAKKIPLRLDSEGAASSVVAGGAQAKLIQRITADDKASRMPPVYSGLSLTPTEIETLRLWVMQGAKWEKHWSFIAPERPPLPKVKNTAWPRNPIDYFILDRLEREGLAPSPEASREALIRRVSLDLTGLPPTPLEVDAFIQDKSPNAYEKVVDRLLASPRYGERMAARWLDGARYADSNGYQYDGERVMWRWRDWVIAAFNRNQPFDRFTLEQLAGDMLPNATLSQKIATGFNRNHRANTEDGIIPEEYAVEYVVDRVETTSAMFLGLTLGCARCHNHKYDPFTQKEFYQVFAYFNNVPEMGRAMKYGNSPPLVPAPTDEQQRAHDDLSDRIRVLENYLRDRSSAIEAAQKPWEAAMTKAEPAQWAPAGEVSLVPKANDGAAFAPGRVGRAFSFDGKGYFDAGDAAAFDIDDRFTLSAWVYSDSTPDGSILTRMQDTPRGRGYGVLLNKGKVHVHFTSNYDDDAIRIETEETLSPKRWYHIAVTYTGSKMAEGVQVYIDGQPAKGKVLLDTLYRPFRNAGRRFPEPLRVGAGAGPARRFRGLIDGIHIYGRVLGEQDIAALALGESIDSIARKPASERSRSRKRRIAFVFPGERRAPGNSPSLGKADGAPPGKRTTGSHLPQCDGHGRKSGAEADAPADPRRIRQARRNCGARHSVCPCPAPGRRGEQPAGLREVARQPRKSAARARHREPLLADVFRHRNRENGRGFRRAGRMALPSGTARLARHRICSHRLGRQGHAEADRDERGIPAIVGSQAGAGGARSRKPPVWRAARVSACPRK